MVELKTNFERGQLNAQDDLNENFKNIQNEINKVSTDEEWTVLDITHSNVPNARMALIRTEETVYFSMASSFTGATAWSERVIATLPDKYVPNLENSPLGNLTFSVRGDVTGVATLRIQGNQLLLMRCNGSSSEAFFDVISWPAGKTF